MGGSDQWGNITSGTEFIRRNLGGKAYALTTPLLTKTDGAKFGKSESGNIWLDPKMTSPYAFYQFWINADDRDILTFTRYFSLCSQEEIETREHTYAENPQMLKQLLAEEITERVHSKEALKSAQNVSQLLFHSKADAAFLLALSDNEMQMVRDELPGFSLSKNELDGEGTEITELLSTSTSIFASKGEVRRAITNNAISINKHKVTSPDQRITRSDLLHGRYLMVENGKKNKYLIQII
jgi:tyrosyl-tRNA synthetase